MANHLGAAMARRKPSSSTKSLKCRNDRNNNSTPCSLFKGTNRHRRAGSLLSIMICILLKAITGTARIKMYWKMWFRSRADLKVLNRTMGGRGLKRGGMMRLTSMMIGIMLISIPSISREMNHLSEACPSLFPLGIKTRMVTKILRASTSLWTLEFLEIYRE